MRNVEYTETGQVMELRTKLDLGMRGSVLDFSSLEYVVLLPYILGWMYTCGLDYRRITLWKDVSDVFEPGDIRVLR